MQLQQVNPTLKGRLLSLQNQARRMKQIIGQNQKDVKLIINQIQQGTQSSILNDKINHIRQILNQKIQQINYKAKKHIAEQKQKNNQLIELIGIIKNQKVRLQEHLSQLEDRIEKIRTKAGIQQSSL